MSADARNKVIELIEEKYKKLIQHIAREILTEYSKNSPILLGSEMNC